MQIVQQEFVHIPTALMFGHDLLPAHKFHPVGKRLQAYRVMRPAHRDGIKIVLELHQRPFARKGTFLDAGSQATLAFEIAVAQRLKRRLILGEELMACRWDCGAGRYRSSLQQRSRYTLSSSMLLNAGTPARKSDCASLTRFSTRPFSLPDSRLQKRLLKT